ncbi:hypothetical protein ALO90_102546 [Pseudomonas amygdali pv. aesculi]|nr:hypothetical protein ALO90_102546 [Pseudomonas amygdali pv. aesculi]
MRRHLQITGLLIIEHAFEVGDGLCIVRCTHGAVGCVLNFTRLESGAAVDPFELVQRATIVARLAEEIGNLHFIAGLQFARIASFLQTLQCLTRLAHRCVQGSLLAQGQITHGECLSEVLTRTVLIAQALTHLSALDEQGGVVAIERQCFGSRRARFGILPLGNQGADQQLSVSHLFRKTANSLPRLADSGVVISACQCLITRGCLIDCCLFLNRLPTTSQSRLRADCLLCIVDGQLCFVQTLLTLQRLDQHHAVIKIFRCLCDGLARMVCRAVVVAIGIRTQRLIALQIARFWASLGEALRVISSVFVAFGQGNQIAQLIGIRTLTQRFARLGDGQVVVLAVVGHVGFVGDGVGGSGQRQGQCFRLAERCNKTQAAHQQRQDEGALHSGCSV